MLTDANPSARKRSAIGAEGTGLNSKRQNVAQGAVLDNMAANQAAQAAAQAAQAAAIARGGRRELS